MEELDWDEMDEWHRLKRLRDALLFRAEIIAHKPQSDYQAGYTRAIKELMEVLVDQGHDDD